MHDEGAPICGETQASNQACIPGNTVLDHPPKLIIPGSLECMHDDQCSHRQCMMPGKQWIG